MQNKLFLFSLSLLGQGELLVLGHPQHPLPWDQHFSSSRKLMAVNHGLPLPVPHDGSIFSSFLCGFLAWHPGQVPAEARAAVPAIPSVWLCKFRHLWKMELQSCQTGSAGLRIREELRLERSSGIIESNCSNIAKAIPEMCPQVPHPLVFGTLRRMGNPSLPWAAVRA